MPTAAAAKRQQRRAESRTAGQDDYNADARTERLTKATITIGGKPYHRRVKDNEVSQKILDLQEDQEIANRKAIVIEKQMAELEDTDDTSRWDDLRQKRREFTNEAIEAGHETLAIMLQDAEGSQPPIDAVRKLEERVVVELTELLAGGGEPLEGPTQTPESSG